MVDSLIKNTNKINHHVHILALDFVTERYLGDYYKECSKVTIHSLGTLGTEYIWDLRKSRSHREFCWGLSSILTNFILEETKGTTIYLDADIFFFSDPSPLVTECAIYSIAVTPHRFPDRLKFQEIMGIYNVQWVQFKFDDEGRAASTKWRRQCEASSSYAPDLGIVGDQKYLDSWHLEYKSFKSINNVGAGLAPWNHEKYKLRLEDGITYVNDLPLIFYHFHSFSISDLGKITLANAMYAQVVPLPTSLYLTYLEKLRPLYYSLMDIISLPNPETWKIPRNQSAIRRFLGYVLLRISK
jgi:hypothetical protein